MSHQQLFDEFMQASWKALQAEYPEHYTDDDYDSGETLESITSVVINGQKLFEVDSVGGEGQGDYAHLVYALVPADIDIKRNSDKSVDSAIMYIKLNGFYSSYNGTDWDFESVDVVKPTPVIKTEWR